MADCNCEEEASLFLADAHAHLGGRAEWEERLRNPIPTLVSAGNPQEAKRLGTVQEDLRAGRVLIPTYGLHPWYANLDELREMKPFMELGGIVGEIGMDSEWCDVPLPLQRKVFEQQLEFAAERCKPVILHTKGQEKEIAKIIGQYPNRYLVHWYSEEKYLEEYLAKDCFFSIGPDVWWNPAVQRVAALAPDKRILIETDGMGAVAWAYEEAAKRNRVSSAVPVPTTVAASLHNTLACVAKIRNISIERIAEQMEYNFIQFCKTGKTD